MKKRFFGIISALLAVLTLLLAFTSCNDGREGETIAEATESVSAEPSGYTLNGAALESYVIHYAWRNTYGEKDGALKIAEAIKTVTGVELTVFDDTDGVGECAIVVGDSEHGTSAEKNYVGELEYSVKADGTLICLLSVTEYGFILATEELCKSIDGSKDMKVESTETLSYADSIINSMTFNILNWDTSLDHLAAIQSVIKKFTPDTIGFQEITADWITKIMQDSTISGLYGHVGRDREDGTGEQSAIFYRKDKFELVERGTRWMYGDTPTGSNTPGRLKSALYNRVYTYAVLKCLSSGKNVVAINTHLDLTGGDMTLRNTCQTAQVGYALAMVAELEAKYEISATVFTGDFNATIEKPACTSILEAGFVQAQTNSKILVGAEAPEGSNYKQDTLYPEGRGICRGIDHVFVKGDHVWLEEYEICNQKYRGEYPSDHIPRIARYLLQ